VKRSNFSYPYGKPVLDNSDIQAVLEVLKTDFLSSGPKISEFEQAISQKLQIKCTSVVSSGTAALHLTALALGWEKGDIVLTTPLTFLATANCAVYVGATPDFVDIDPISYTIDVDKLEEKIKKYVNQGKIIKAIIAVDFAGHPSDWNALTNLSQKYGLQLVDDASHALGASYHDHMIGSSEYADITTFSFHPVKHITTGEGGAVLTKHKEIDEKIKRLRNHGMTKNPNLLQTCDGPWYYEMHEMGFNYRITDIQCALGITQFNKLDSFIEQRQKIATFYNTFFANDERFIIPQLSGKHIKHAYHLYPLQIEFSQCSISKVELFEKLREKNIFVQVHYIPLHLQPFYQKELGYGYGSFPNAEKYYEREVSLPMFPGLKQEDLEYIGESILEVIGG